MSFEKTNRILSTTSQCASCPSGNNWYSLSSNVDEEWLVLFWYWNSNRPVKRDCDWDSTLRDVETIRLRKLSKPASWFNISEHGYSVSRWKNDKSGQSRLFQYKRQ